MLRARFSEITPRAVRAACENLTEPDQRVSDAVDVRQELDLRIGEEPERLPLPKWVLVLAHGANNNSMVHCCLVLPSSALLL